VTIAQLPPVKQLARFDEEKFPWPGRATRLSGAAFAHGERRGVQSLHERTTSQAEVLAHHAAEAPELP
jgi:hypothetical protein